MIKTIITSSMLGIGLAMDASAVSMANGLNDPKMKMKKCILISLMFALFQGLMPLIGYFIGNAILTKIEWLIPWIALFLLVIVGANMLYEGIKNKNDENVIDSTLTFKDIIIQSIATSIDALSVGLTIANYQTFQALISVTIISIITFFICFGAIFIGKKFGTKLGNKAEILGGCILIIIGIEIFIQGIFL